MSIGNLDTINVNLIKRLKAFDGTNMRPNDETYETNVNNIRGAIVAIGEDCKRWWDGVGAGEMERTNKQLPGIFNSFVQALTNFNKIVNNVTKVDELTEASEDFDDRFIKKLSFNAVAAPGSDRRFIIGSIGLFNAHNWFDDATDQESITAGDNGSYKLIGQLVDRVYLMLTTTIDKASEIISKKKAELSGDKKETTDNSSSSKTTTQGSTSPEAQKAMEASIRSLIDKKTKLMHKQANIINQLNEVTAAARKIYVRQFLKEDAAATTATAAPAAPETTGGTSTQQPISLPTTIAPGEAPTNAGPSRLPTQQPAEQNPEEKQAERKPEEKTEKAPTIEVDPDNPIYKGISEIIDLQQRLENFYNASLNLFKNGISAKSRHLSDLSSGKIKNSMSTEDRIKAFNNYKYADFDKKTQDAQTQGQTSVSTSVNNATGATTATSDGANAKGATQTPAGTPKTPEGTPVTTETLKQAAKATETLKQAAKATDASKTTAGTQSR